MFHIWLRGSVCVPNPLGIAQDRVIEKICDDLQKQWIEPKVDRNTIRFDNWWFSLPPLDRYCLVGKGEFAVVRAGEFFNVSYALSLNKALIIFGVLGLVTFIPMYLAPEVRFLGMIKVFIAGFILPVGAAFGALFIVNKIFLKSVVRRCQSD